MSVVTKAASKLEPISLYIHHPHCYKLCTYCAFPKSLRKAQTVPSDIYISNLKHYPERVYESVYFGGGTPSLEHHTWAEDILKAAKWKEGAEITMEANPRDINLEKLQKWKQAGINRISLGVQTFSERLARILGRDTNIDTVRRAIDQVGTVFENWSFDIIFAAPSQTMKEFEYDLAQAIETQPPHLTFYALELEPSTPLHKSVQAGELSMPSQEESEQMYLQIEQNLTSKYDHYEPSHYARKDSIRDYKGKHNIHYWSGHDYIAIGPGGVGRYTEGNRRIRYQNIPSWSQYHRAYKSKEPFNAAAREIVMTTKETIRDLLLFAIRYPRRGILLSHLQRFDPAITSWHDIFDMELLRACEDEDYLSISSDKIQLNKSGFNLMDGIIRRTLR